MRARKKCPHYIYKFAILLSLVINYIILLLNTIYKDYNIIDIKDLNNSTFIIKDDITLVSAFFKIKSKHSFKDYSDWIDNFLQINCPMVFFIDKSIYKKIIVKRPQKLLKKTVWIILNIKDFYSYKHYLKEFNQTYELDYEKNYQTVFLYLIWAEKCNFVKTAILNNFFKSKCFYWVDAGCFRDKKKMKSYIKNWPSKKKCLKDRRIIFNEIRRPSRLEKDELKKFNTSVHINFQHLYNVDGSLFGGQKKNLIKFCNLYYDTINLFLKNKIFIGKDQNLFAFIAYFNQNLVKLVYSGKWFYLQDYISKNYD